MLRAVRLGPRVCQVETWEVKPGELFGAALGKGLCYWVKGLVQSLPEFGREHSRGALGG